MQCFLSLVFTKKNEYNQTRAGKQSDAYSVYVILRRLPFQGNLFFKTSPLAPLQRRGEMVKHKQRRLFSGKTTL